jgi:hypothetical protein
MDFSHGKNLEPASLSQKHLPTQPMPLQLFIERAARQLQFFKHRFHIALVPG